MSDKPIGTKNERGRYIPTALSLPGDLKQTPILPQTVAQLEIDGLLKKCLMNLAGILRAVQIEVNLGAPSREAVQNLKDVTVLLMDLKKKEQELLNDMSEEELQELLRND